MKLVVIPACGGSKRIPRNNTKLFCDSPMIKWSIEGTLLRGGLDKVIASTAKDGMALTNNVELTQGQQKGIPAWN